MTYDQEVIKISADELKKLRSILSELPSIHSRSIVGTIALQLSWNQHV